MNRSSETTALLEEHRGELTGHARRMLRSAFEAEDAVQETLLRAWRAFDRFEGRAALRSWLYRIATNVCLDMLASRARRARHIEGGATTAAPSDPAAWTETLTPEPRLPAGHDPADTIVVRESVRLALVAAIQRLPPRQRAVLILREVLRWRSTEVAELLGSSVASVNSALQRARATMASVGSPSAPAGRLGTDEQALLARYVAAFEQDDVTSLVALLREDASGTTRERWWGQSSPRPRPLSRP